MNAGIDPFEREARTIVPPFIKGNGADYSYMQLFLPPDSDIGSYDSVFIKSRLGEFELIVLDIETIDDDGFMEHSKMATVRRHDLSTDPVVFDPQTIEARIVSSSFSSFHYRYSSGGVTVKNPAKGIKCNFTSSSSKIIKAHSHSYSQKLKQNGKANSIRSRVSKVFQRKGR